MKIPSSVRSSAFVLNHKYLFIGLTVVFMIGRIGCPPVDPKKPSTNSDANDVPNEELGVSS